MDWTVTLTRAAAKQVARLNPDLKAAVRLLVRDLQEQGASLNGQWSNYGKLRGQRGDKRHCHLSKGRPTYVCCWQVINKQNLEVYYVGTHEKAPYG